MDVDRPNITTAFESAPLNQRMRLAQEAILSHAAPALPQSTIDDNTAAGMALSQEDSMYISLSPSPSPLSSPGMTDYHDASQVQVRVGIQDTEIMVDDDDEDENEGEDEEEEEAKQVFHLCESETMPFCDVNTSIVTNAIKDITHPPESDPQATIPTSDSLHAQNNQPDLGRNQASVRSTLSLSPERTSPPYHEDVPAGLARVDLGINRSSGVKGWDFTDKKPGMKSPSSLFQPYSKFVGTQQSDRQTYNVEVTILTVDMDKSSLSGYLMIRGLTPEHPMLQTFFTGEIVGGPNQKYSFKTMDPAWGAQDKVDLQHWLRFPPWRQFTSYAKRDMSFEFPLDDEPWWTQEHIYMRWKEHFLVPDHKQSNIQGASFEGFYYICLNQFEGKVSGVYFHSKSEKYQQLELTHVTKRGLGVFGVSPLVELR